MLRGIFSRCIGVMMIIAVVVGCSKEDNGATEASEVSYAIAVFIPGVVAGSPTYEMLANGVTKAASERSNVSVNVVEGGFNQGDWIDSVTALASAKKYDLIISSNPALPEICQEVSLQFPDQHFLVLDGYLPENNRIHTVLYNQMEQAFMIGHLAGLITTGDLSGANDDLVVGLVAGTEYSMMNQVIRVGFELGMKKVDPNAKLDFRVVGNWYDAAKAAELATGIFGAGADVILTIAGGANQGVISEAQKRGKYVLWFDSNGYGIAPGTVLGSSAIKQDEMAYKKTLAAIDGKLPFGTAEIVGVRDGYVEFIEDDPLYLEHVPESIQKIQRELVSTLESGDLSLVMPVF